jgi:hypothetical protein
VLNALVLEAVKKVPKDGEGVKSGPIGLAVILVLCVAVYFLLKSMSKHLKKVRDEFPTDVAAPPITRPASANAVIRPNDPAAKAPPAQPAQSAPAQSVTDVPTVETPPQPGSA